MGCRKWAISGGEPMIRPDFLEIFDYITSRSASYTIFTNGTLITPKIAKAFRKIGAKKIALYGATAKVHEHITRHPGSFEQTMAGLRYLKEAGAGFIVQIIPMKDNYHQFNAMVKLAASLTKNYRVGASWLFLAASGDPKINREITAQRLSPEEWMRIDKLDASSDACGQRTSASICQSINEQGYLFSSCIKSRRDFNIDPYGRMSFCAFIKGSRFRYDLRKGSFREGWDKFIPSLAQKVKATEEYNQNCGACELKPDCLWRPVYGYLEHRRFSAKVEYLCAVARENRKFKDNWLKEHRRYFNIAGITIQLDSDLPITAQTFHPKFKHFAVKGPQKDTIKISLHFPLPGLEGKDLGQEMYRRPPWAVYKKGDSWIYLGISKSKEDEKIHRMAVFNHDHTRARIYNTAEIFYKGNLHSLTLFPSDQILLARVLADRQGCYVHASGVNFAGNGLLFAGHSEAGKSTIATILKGQAEILCDDRMIIRSHLDGFRIYGTWSHGDVPDVSPNSAPLKAILFLKKSKTNRMTRLTGQKEIVEKMLGCLVRPFVTRDWWEKNLALIDRISRDVPCYVLEFDKSGGVVDILGQLRG